MVYDWAGKREICFQMYIQEKKALEEIMDKRAFQTQFKRWGFPSKQNPAHKNVELVARVKQLWESNTSQRDMLRILNDEGFAIKERELMRVRAKNRWLLRVPNGMKSHANVEAPPVHPEDEGLLALQQEVYKVESALDDPNSLTAEPDVERPTTESPGLSPEAIAKRQERLDRLKAESAERWASRKRRRRTRGWAGLPADPPGPPRFPSETTIDESKQYLNLDNTMYRQTRDHFQRICEEAGFIKKTAAGPERWQAAKEKLIQESPHLQQVFNTDPSQRDAKVLALDVVCTDVTKRMRTLERRMTIAEAKNALGINPEESRQIRNAFYETLKVDHFTSKFEAGDEHWRELKEQWVGNSELLRRILAPGQADPDHGNKLKALEVLCRDVMKRLRDDQTKRDPARKRSSARAQSRTSTPTNTSMGNMLGLGNEISNGISTLASQALASAPITATDIGDMQIDPSLLQAANDPSFSTNSQHDTGNAFEYVDPMLSSALLPTPVYFQIGSESQSQETARKSWPEKLATRTVDELRQLFAARHPYSIITRIEGVDRDQDGNEMLFSIDEDHELDAYLTHVHGRKALLVFTLSQI
ncbi:uncharacterized protein N7511_007238 [Penicillium nucicola]|uniref:uncharacterized protein n=1 Tax=Penicillium nucicola TaxID=1850975 RepID=UPI00254581C9|nr:uncharacterized protein N7511_007238 [Penicillium nucicola]KAJ5757056.1 hypothetical protein N7511_007238 [Penicillium nucicola]